MPDLWFAKNLVNQVSFTLACFSFLFATASLPNWCQIILRMIPLATCCVCNFKKKVLLTMPVWVYLARCGRWRGKLLPGGRVSPELRRWRWGRWALQKPPLWSGWCSRPESLRLWPPGSDTAGLSTGRCKPSATGRTVRSPWGDQDIHSFIFQCQIYFIHWIITIQ